MASLPLPSFLIPQPFRWRGATVSHLTAGIPLFICALFLLVGLVAVDVDTDGVDLYIQRQTAGFTIDNVLGKDDRPGNYYYWFYGVAFELPLLLAERALGLEDIRAIKLLRYLLTHLLFIVAGFFCYRLVYQLFNNRLLAIFALLLFLLHPRIYAHSFINSKDLPLLSGFMIALYLLERALRRDTARAFILCGIGVGLLTNVRIMGAMLFPAVLTLRGIDLFSAGSWPRRKPILLTAGAFALVSILALYATWPYLWSNPIGNFLEGWAWLAQNARYRTFLFRGEWVSWAALPADYIPVWFGITTPLPVLLLGFTGAIAVICRGIAQPRAIFHNTPLRFPFLLLAAFILPVAAVILLGSSLYDGWRHLFFIYAPFCLLAVWGLAWLSLARPGKIWRGGVYGLTGLGILLTVLQILQLYPWHEYYYNSLVARAVPEYLRTQYDMQHRLKLRGDAPEHLRDSKLNAPVYLSAGAAGGASPAAGRDPDYFTLINPYLVRQPDTAFNRPYAVQIYNNTLVIVKTTDTARLPAAAVAAYQELYQQAVAGGAPIIRDQYDVYLNGRTLTFVKENCPPGALSGIFRAKIYRANAPRPSYFHRRLEGDSSINSGVRLRSGAGEQCLAVLQLPETGENLLLGQYEPETGGLPLWEELYSFRRPGLTAALSELRTEYPATAAPGQFSVRRFLSRSGESNLLYFKPTCTPEDAAAHFFLHIYPVVATSLAPESQSLGFANADFNFWKHGIRPGGDCFAVVPLPDYPIAEIATGQAGQWTTRFPVDLTPERRATYARLSARQPTASGYFALYRQGNKLHYVRESCAAGDTAAQFFLHIIPVDPDDLAPEWRPRGFENRDFDFATFGSHFAGRCLATVPLPDYPIAEIRTGQYVPSQGELWSAALN